MGKTRKKKVRGKLAGRFIFLFALSQFSGPDSLGAWNGLSFDLIVDPHQNKRFYVTEIVVPLGFADVTFWVEHAERNDNRKYNCVRTL